MPELPEVETVCRGLRPALEGRRLVAVRTLRPDLRTPFPPRFAERLTGRRVIALSRRAKYMIWTLDDGWAVLAHLGMSGRMLVGPADGPPPGRHDHVVLDTEDGLRVVFHDPRRFGLMDLVEASRVTEHPLLRDLGPEPLDVSFTGAVLAGALKGKITPVKVALLDQRVVAGLGNIYACEALFRAGIAPTRPAGEIRGKRATALVMAIKAVLKEAIAAGGSSLRDHRRPDGELGYFQHSFAVYGREGERCPGCSCYESIKRVVLGGRSTYYCANRQR